MRDQRFQRMCKILWNYYCSQLYMFFYPTKMDIEFVQVFKKCSKGSAFSHLCKGIYIFREAFAAIAVLAIGTWYVGMSIVDISRQQYACVNFAPISAHLFAILATGVEIGYLVGSEDVVHVLCQLCFERGHHGELLAYEDFGEQVVGSCEDHGLFFEILNMCTLGEEFWHVAHLMASLFGKPVTGSGKDCGTYEDWHIREILNQFGHQTQVLRTVVLGRHMDLQKSDIDIAQVVIVAFGRVADEEFAFRIVMFQPVFEGSANEATSNNSNVNHCVYYLLFIIRVYYHHNCGIV